MNEGVVTTLKELIALRRYAHAIHYRPEQNARRAGNHQSRLRGRGMDFAEVRNYQSGDEIRHMEWRVTARTGRPHVKLFQEERERPVIILTDFNPSMYFGTRIAFKSVVAARLAAIISWIAVVQGDRIGGLLFSATAHSEFMPRAREAGVLPYLAGLEAYTIQLMRNHGDVQSNARRLSDALLRLRRVARPGSVLVLISDFYHLDEESEQHLSRLRNHNDILAYHICDPMELAPPKPQQYPITNGQQELLLDTSVATVSAAYRQYCCQRISNLNAMMQRMQIQCTQVMAEMDLSMLVKRTYPRRSLRV